MSLSGTGGFTANFALLEWVKSNEASNVFFDSNPNGFSPSTVAAEGSRELGVILDPSELHCMVKVVVW